MASNCSKDKYEEKSTGRPGQGNFKVETGIEQKRQDSGPGGNALVTERWFWEGKELFSTQFKGGSTDDPKKSKVKKGDKVYKPGKQERSDGGSSSGYFTWAIKECDRDGSDDDDDDDDDGGTPSSGCDKPHWAIFEECTQVNEGSYYEGQINRSSDSGAEHQIVYVNESKSTSKITQYEEITMMGLSLRATREFNNLDQPRVYLEGGLEVSELEELPAVTAPPPTPAPTPVQQTSGWTHCRFRIKPGSINGDFEIRYHNPTNTQIQYTGYIQNNPGNWLCCQEPVDLRSTQVNGDTYYWYRDVFTANVKSMWNVHLAEWPGENHGFASVDPAFDGTEAIIEFYTGSVTFTELSEHNNLFYTGVFARTLNRPNPPWEQLPGVGDIGSASGGHSNNYWLNDAVDNNDDLVTSGFEFQLWVPDVINDQGGTKPYILDGSTRTRWRDNGEGGRWISVDESWNGGVAGGGLETAPWLLNTSGTPSAAPTSGPSQASIALSNGTATRGRSNNYADLIYWLLTDKGAGVGDVVSTEMIDVDRMVTTSKFIQKMGLTWDGSISEKTNLRSFASQTAPFFLCNFTITNGNFTLWPVIPVDQHGNFKNERAYIKQIFTEGNIIDGSFSLDYLDADDRRPFKAAMRYRVMYENQLPEERTLTTRWYTGKFSDPTEDFDMTQFCTTPEHALLAARYFMWIRNVVTHSVKLQTVPEVMNGVGPGDFIKVKLDSGALRHRNVGAVTAEGFLYSAAQWVDGTYDVNYWKPGMSEPREATITISDGAITDSGFENALISLQTPLDECGPTDNCYQVESVNLEEDGLVGVTASYYPIDDAGVADLYNALFGLGRWSRSAYCIEDGNFGGACD